MTIHLGQYDYLTINRTIYQMNGITIASNDDPEAQQICAPRTAILLDGARFAVEHTAINSGTQTVTLARSLRVPAPEPNVVRIRFEHAGESVTINIWVDGWLWRTSTEVIESKWIADGAIAGDLRNALRIGADITLTKEARRQIHSAAKLIAAGAESSELRFAQDDFHRR